VLTHTCIAPQVLPYDVLMQQLEVPTVRELEDLLINECMATGLVRGKLDQRRQGLTRSAPPHFLLIVHLYNTCTPLPPPPPLPCLFAAVQGLTRSPLLGSTACRHSCRGRGFVPETTGSYRDLTPRSRLR